MYVCTLACDYCMTYGVITEDVPRMYCVGLCMYVRTVYAWSVGSATAMCIIRASGWIVRLL